MEGDHPSTFYDLRHTCNNAIYQLGEHPKIVSERLGHSRVGVTMDVFSHVMPDMQKDVADNFERMAAIVAILPYMSGSFAVTNAAVAL